MAEIVSIKTTKPPVESITVKLTKAEAQDVIRAYSSYWGPSAPIAKKLKDAVEGKTSSLSDSLMASLTAPRPF